MKRLSLDVTVLVVAMLASGVRASDAQPDQAQDLKRLSLEELMELDVTSVSRRAERIVDAPAAVSVITAEDIRRSGVSTLPDALRLADGITVARFNGASWAISTRGFTATANNKLLVQIDGRPVYTQLFGGVFWETFDYVLADIDRIEVIRGPAGTLWGPNAVNGVINVVTKRASDTQGGRLTLRAGSREPGTGLFRYGARIGSSGAYRVYGKSTHFASPQFATGVSAHEGRNMHQAGFRADFGSVASQSAVIQGDFSYGRFGRFDFPDGDHWNGNLLFRWNRQIKPGSSLGLLTYVDRGQRQVPGQSWERRTIYEIEAQHDIQLAARHRVVSGGGFRVTNDQTRPTPIVFWEPANRNIYQVELFGQDEIVLQPQRLFLTVGSRVERTTFSGVEVQPSVRLRYHPAERTTLWGAVSRAVRTPTRIDQDLRIAVGSTVAIRGDRAFLPEDLFAYEVGVRQRLNARVSMEATGFYHDYADLRSQEPTPPLGIPIVLRNLLEGRSAGIELAGNYEPYSTWLLHAGYTWQTIDLRPAPGSRDTTDGLAEAQDPRHVFSARSYLDLPNSLEFDLLFRAIGDLRGKRTPGYRELDARFGWQATPRLSLSLIGRDLLHRRHVEFASGTTERRFFQREVLGRVTWEF